LFFDVDGIGGVGQVQFAKLIDTTGITNKDIVISS
jgi:hypothetical protein